MGNDMSREGGAVDEVTFANGAVVGDIRVMEQLLAHKPAILYARSRELNTVWHYAAQGGHVEVLDWLAEVGIGIRAPLGASLLFWPDALSCGFDHLGQYHMR